MAKVTLGLVVSLICMVQYYFSVAEAVYSHSFALRSLSYSFGSYCSVSSLEAWDCYWCRKVPGFQVEAVINQNNLLAFVGYDSIYQQTVVSFRGSRDIQNWITDLSVFEVKFPDVSGGYIHYGFFSAWNNTLAVPVMSAVATVMAAHPTRPVLVTGHSLGGTLSQIAVMSIRKFAISSGYDVLIKNYHFGTLRWANSELATYYETKVDEGWRIVNKRDIAATVPLIIQGFPSLYHHTNTEIRYTRNFWGKLVYKQCDGSGEDLLCAYLFPSLIDHMTYLGVSIPEFLKCYVAGALSNAIEEIEEIEDEETHDNYLPSPPTNSYQDTGIDYSWLQSDDTEAERSNN